MSYPAGLCVTIEYQSMSIKITALDSLGGNYAIDCQLFRELGPANWVWSIGEVITTEASHEATILRQCDSDAAGAKCFTASYRIPTGDKGHVVIHGDDPILFVILRTYREALKTALYCPGPAPTRLKAGESA